MAPLRTDDTPRAVLMSLTRFAVVLLSLVFDAFTVKDDVVVVAPTVTSSAKVASAERRPKILLTEPSVVMAEAVLMSTPAPSFSVTSGVLFIRFDCAPGTVLLRYTPMRKFGSKPALAST